MVFEVRSLVRCGLVEFGIDNCDVIGSATGDNATVPHTLEKCDVSPILYASVGRRSPRHDSACPSEQGSPPDCPSSPSRALVGDYLGDYLGE